MLSAVFRINEVAGINLHLLPDGTVESDLVVLKADGNQLELIKKVTAKKGIKELLEHLDVKTPVALNITGKGVLIKKTEGEEEITAANFQRVLPNAEANDFYWQNMPTVEGIFVALIRKSEADRWLTELAGNSIQVLALSLGPFPVQLIQPQLNFYGEEVVFNGHCIQREAKGDWQTYRYEAGKQAPFPIKLENEKLDDRLVVPYAIAFQVILSRQMQPVWAPVPEITGRLNQYLQNRKISVISAFALGLLFLMLLINFLLVSHYQSENEKMSFRASQTAADVADLDSLSAQIKSKQAQLDTLGWDGGLSHSVQIDRLAKLVPSGVSWREASVNPEDRNVQNKAHGPRFLTRQISIQGTSERIVAVNEWVSRIKSLSWVKDAQLQRYNYNNELATGEFLVLIRY
jgi:Tfp pilus assembly protein PilN